MQQRGTLRIGRIVIALVVVVLVVSGVFVGYHHFHKKQDSPKTTDPSCGASRTESKPSINAC